MRARVQADVNQFVITHVHALAPGSHLRVPRLIRVARPAGVNPDRCAVHRPEHQWPHRVGSQLRFNGAEAADQDVFNHLLGQRSETVIRVRRVQISCQDSNPLILDCFCRAGVLELHPPPHPRNSIFDGVDRFARDRCFRESPQVGRRRFWQCLSSQPAWNTRQDNRLPHLLACKHLPGPVEPGPNSRFAHVGRNGSLTRSAAADFPDQPARLL